MKILIAEDTPCVQKMVMALMGKWGYNFDLVENGIEALKTAKSNNGEYDLCLMDIDMPQLNGIEAAIKIRKSVRYFPIMAMSGDHSHQTACFNAGIDDFIEKPYNLSLFHNKINELTVKTLAVHRLKQNKVVVKKETPMNAEELNELRELDRKGLAKFNIVEANYQFIVHKNIQNKISHDFIANGKLLSEFLDRNPESPGIIHLYATNLLCNKRHILPEIFAKLAEQEDIELTKYAEKAEFPVNK